MLRGTKSDFGGSRRSPPFIQPPGAQASGPPRGGNHFFIIFLSILPPPSFHPPNPSFDPPRPPLTPPEAHLDPILPPPISIGREIPRCIFKVSFFRFSSSNRLLTPFGHHLEAQRPTRTVQEAQRGSKSSPLEGGCPGPFSIIFRLTAPRRPRAPKTAPRRAK